MAATDWIVVSGRELEEQNTAGARLDDLLDPCQAIYVWRRNAAPPQHVLVSSHAFCNWLHNSLSKPFAIVPSQDLAHFVQLLGLQVGGGKLTSSKLATLESWTQDSKNRKRIASYLKSLNELMPPLYVGETDNLPKRIRDHLSGDTDFSQTLKLSLNLTWSEMNLCYFRLRPASTDADDNDHTDKAKRTLLEYIAAKLLLAGSTSRPG